MCFRVQTISASLTFCITVYEGNVLFKLCTGHNFMALLDPWSYERQHFGHKTLIRMKNCCDLGLFKCAVQWAEKETGLHVSLSRPSGSSASAFTRILQTMEYTFTLSEPVSLFYLVLMSSQINCLSPALIIKCILLLSNPTISSSRAAKIMIFKQVSTDNSLICHWSDNK